MIEQVNSLEKFLTIIEERTPMYLGGRTIVHLKAFLDGWFFGKEDEIKDSHLLSEFQEWLQKKYQINSTQSWAQIILFYSMDEFAALDRFFLLFKEFLRQKANNE